MLPHTLFSPASCLLTLTARICLENTPLERETHSCRYCKATIRKTNANRQYWRLNRPLSKFQHFTSENRKVCWCQKGERWNHNKQFLKNHRNCYLSDLQAGSLFRTSNSYLFIFNSELCNFHPGSCLWRIPSPEGEQFLWFWNMTSSISPHFALFWHRQIFVCFF